MDPKIKYREQLNDKDSVLPDKRQLNNFLNSQIAKFETIIPELINLDP